MREDFLANSGPKIPTNFVIYINNNFMNLEETNSARGDKTAILVLL